MSGLVVIPKRRNLGNEEQFPLSIIFVLFLFYCKGQKKNLLDYFIWTHINISFLRQKTFFNYIHPKTVQVESSFKVFLVFKNKIFLAS